MTHATAYQKRLQQARQKRAYHTKQRRLQQARERLRREQARAQHHVQALEQALQALGLPETVAEEVEWRLQAQQKLLGKIVAMMFPPGVWLSQLP